MLNRELLSIKIAAIINQLSKKLQITPERALHLFYTSDTCQHLHNQETSLYLMSDLYIVDEIIKELQDINM